MKKKYDATSALHATDSDKVDYQKYIEQLPEEFRAEVGEAITKMLTYVHSKEGTAQIVKDLRAGQGNIAALVGISALKVMDACDPGHKWSDSAKVLAGYFSVKEVSAIARAAGIANLDKEQESKVYKAACQNYLYGVIKSKPSQQEREAEAVRIQKEVDPLVNSQDHARGNEAAAQAGIPQSQPRNYQQAQQRGQDQGAQGQQLAQGQQRGLLE